MSVELPPLVLELRARAAQLHATIEGAKSDVKSLGTETESSSKRSQSAMGGLASFGRTALIGISTAAASGGIAALKLGTDFQASTTQLVTGAGESEKNLNMVRSGILAMAGSVGQLPINLSRGMYLIESAGYHGAQGLNVLKAAAEGAKVGGADMATVANGLTTALTDYHIPAAQAATVTSKLVATVAAGKTTMGDLSGALAHVLPFASSLGIGLNQTLGAMANMTGQGINAADAATYLKSTVMSLGNEVPKGAKALKMVGLSAAQVHDDLKSKGLTGTLAEITNAIGKKFPQGSAAYTAAMSDISGGTKGMAAVLALTGTHAAQFVQNVQGIGSATAEAGGHVKGWTETSKDLSTQIDQAKAALVAMGTKIGVALIPWVERAIHDTTLIVGWFSKHTTAAKILGGVIGGVLVTAIAAYAAHLAVAAVQSLKDFGTMMASGASWIAEQTAGFATGVAGMITWTVEHAAMAAGYIAENIAMAASATAAFIAENAATLGIVAGIALVVGGVIWLATHWSTVWNGIKAVLAGAWNDVIKPVFDFIKTVAIDALVAELHILEAGWSTVWTAIKAVISGAWNGVIKPVFGFIRTVAIGALMAEIHIMEAAWSTVWNGIKAVLAGAWNNVIRPVFGAFVSAWNGIKSAAAASWAFLRDDVFTPIKNGFTDLGNFISNAASTISGIFSGFWNGLKSAGATVFNWVAAAWNDTLGSLNFTLPSWIPGIGGDSFGFPRMPTISGYASGGSVADGLFIVGEQGPELMNKTGAKVSVLSNPQTQAALSGTGGGSSGGTGGGHVIEVRMPVYLDSKVLYEGVQRVALQNGARRGPTWQNYRR